MISKGENRKISNTLKFNVITIGIILFTPFLSLGANAPMITTAPNKLPIGAIDKEYQFKLEAIGGVGTLTWSKTSGNLPPGLILDSNGLIFGTPTNTVAPNPLPEIQPYTVEIQVADSAQNPNTAKRTFVMNIYKNELCFFNYKMDICYNSF